MKIMPHFDTKVGSYTHQRTWRAGTSDISRWFFTQVAEKYTNHWRCVSQKKNWMTINLAVTSKAQKDCKLGP